MIRTARLVLRPWRPEDREPFAALNADLEVVEHFPAPLTRAESNALADRAQAGLDARGWGLWAVEAQGAFIGSTGLSVPALRPDWVEVGWRLARPAWGHGYAVEAAQAAVVHGRGLGVGDVVSFTATTNQRSERVMQRLGMQPEGTFAHPALPEGHRLRTHVLYRLPADVPPQGQTP